MNIITYQLQPLSHLLCDTPIQKEDFIKIARENSVKKRLLSLLEMIEFDQIQKAGNEIVLK